LGYYGTWRLISEEIEDTNNGDPTDHWMLRIYHLNEGGKSQIFGSFESGRHITGFERPVQSTSSTGYEKVKSDRKRKRAAEDNPTGRLLSSSAASESTGSENGNLLRALAQERMARQATTAPRTSFAPASSARPKIYSGECKPSKNTRKYGGYDLGDDLDDDSDGK